MELDGGKENQDYFTAQTLGIDNLKCDIAFIHDKELSALDLKAHWIIEENGWQGEEGDNAKLSAEIAQHIKYISDKQYLESVVANMPENIIFENQKIIIALKNYEQVDILNKISDDFDFDQYNIEVRIFNDVNDLFL